MVPLLSLSNITKTYGEGPTATPVLHGVSLTVHAGEFVAIMGPSGSGKSTLMNIIGFLDRPTSGDYLVRGVSTLNLSDDARTAERRRTIGFVFQAFNLLSRTSVLENVMLPLIYAEVPPQVRATRAQTILSAVGMSHRLSHVPSQLSGGERQRVAIARALITNPALLLADEPTGNLDTKTGQDVLGLFQTLHARGHTIVMITHEREAAEYAERIVTLRDGQVMNDARGHQRRYGSHQP